MRRASILAAACLVLACGARRDGTVVRFWAFGREGEEVKKLAPEFERRHPGIRLDVQQVPWTAAHEKLLTAHVGRATPDVAQLGNTWIPEFVALRALAPLEPRLASSTVKRADFFPGSWDSNVVGDTTWGIPWYVDTRVLFYRADLVAQTGVPWPPRTWSAWREAMVRLRDAAPGKRYAILLPVDEWEKPFIFGLQAGATLLADDGRRGAFSEPRFRRAMDFYTGLFADRLAPPLDNTGVANLYQQFAEGYFAMLITGPWNLGEFRSRLPAEMQDRWATAPLPAPDENASYPGASMAGGSSLVVFRDAARKDAAWQLVEFLSEPAQQARFYELSGDLPAAPAAWGLTDLGRNPRAAAFRDQLEVVGSPPKVAEWEQIATRMALAAEQVVRGAKGLDDALSALDHDVDRMLEKRRWMLDHGRLVLHPGPQPLRLALASNRHPERSERSQPGTPGATER
jgi:multiple sugar transport system substrate-binding protein